SKAIITATTDTAGALGLEAAYDSTTGRAYSAVLGRSSCVFDGATTAGDYVQISTTAGDCHDAGATFPTSGGQVLGRVLSTNGARSEERRVGKEGGVRMAAAPVTEEAVGYGGQGSLRDL